MKSVQTIIHVIQGNNGSLLSYRTACNLGLIHVIFVIVQECVTCWCKTTQSCLRVLAS